MNNILKNILLGLLVAGIVSSCTKMKSIGILNTGDYNDTSATLQSVAGDMIIGFGVYQGDANFAKYFPIAAREGSAITPGNELKYGSIVQNDGSFNYTKADALVNQAISAGLQVYGHNLVWYSQQNQTYLQSVGAPPIVMPNLLTNGSFENWSNASSAPSGWSYYNGGTYFSQAASGAQDGSYAVAVAPYGAGTGSDWHVQLATNVPTIPGHLYSVAFYAKSADGSGRIQFEWQGTGGAQYNAVTSVPTQWTQYTESYGNPMTAAATSTTMTFDMAANTNTVYLDNVVVTDKTAADSIAAATSDSAAVANRLDSVLHLWINSTVSRYAGKIKAWDVYNEPFAEDGNLRTNSNNTGNSVTSPGIFVWSNYLGKQTGVSAFKYAHAADPNALLFINEYNLESNSVKLDSLIAYVQWLKAQGVQVDGIGTQMHCSLSTPVAGIDAMFQKLAATGLKIKISELDVTISKASPTDATVGDPITLGSQATMYKYIVSSYMKNVPAAQRYGITIWGVDDPDSWRASQLPLLWDNNFAKKPAYAGFLQGLQQQ